MTQAQRSGPPPIESIVADAAGMTDTGYALRVHMVGLHGLWHRLWALIVLRESIGDADDAVDTVLAQLGQALGRPLADSELAELEWHAIRHAREKPASGHAGA